MDNIGNRMVRAAKLEPAVYEEVEADRSALWQAAAVVVISSLAAGIGATGTQGASGLLSITLAALVGWLVWALLTYLIGARLLPEPQTKTDIQELMRAIGFSSSPGVIRILGVIPGLQTIVFLIAAIWMLVAMVVAVRQALDYKSTGRAVGVCLLGWLVQIILLGGLFTLMGGGPGRG